MERTADVESLLEWQHDLRSLRVDLIGDFAGKELFSIHGDSLMLYCISQARVDFIDGFQLLHAVHAVEAFLANLKQRGCNFHLVWFRADEPLCVPRHASGTKSTLHRLTRAVLIQHFRRSFTCTNGTLQFEFSNVECVEFHKYLAGYAHHFWLCLDGVAFEGCSMTSGILYLKFMNTIASYGYSVALINDLKFVSSKVYASVTSRSCVNRQLEIPALIPRHSKPSPAVSEFWSTLSTLTPENQVWDDGSPLSAREAVTLVGICDTLSKDSCPAMKKCAAAFILHLSALRRCSLSKRSCAPTSLHELEQQSLDSFLAHFAHVCIGIIENSKFSYYAIWDIFDLVDGRILWQVLSNLSSLSLPPDIIAESQTFARRIQKLTGHDITGYLPSSPGDDRTQQLKKILVDAGDLAGSCILPFTHPVLDDYLKSVDVNASEVGEEPQQTPNVFREISHWHNARVSVDPKQSLQRKGFWARKRNQKWMADTIAYSASLTNASGKALDPEIVVVSPAKTTPAQSSAAKGKGSKEDRNSRGKQDTAGKIVKKAPKSGRDRAFEEAQRIKDKKLEDKGKSAANHWSDLYHEFEAESSLSKRLSKASKSFAGLDSQAMAVVGAPMSLYICGILGLMIRDGKKIDERANEMDALAMIWSRLLAIGDMQLSPSVLDQYQLFLKALRIQLPAAPTLDRFLTGQKPALSQVMAASVSNLNLSVDPVEFQLQFCGPFMERSFDSAPDPRVPFFRPDAWQRKVLDAIDANKSLFVVAPTSAGKTFISFYAMKKVLQASDDGVLVYVAPTKALVNQIAAEIQARFSKSYRINGRSVWAVHTRDYRINSPQGCQILVTVPHVLQILLLAPSNADKSSSWSERIKRIIFDEVHSIGQGQDGVIWEQLLLMAPCPIIALSATVGNAHEFNAWLEASEKAKGFELSMVSHSSRYSDLRKHIYHAPVREFTFKGLLPAAGLPIPGLDQGPGLSRFAYIHPVASLVNRNRGTVEDIGLEPRDCLALWRAMVKHQTKNHPIGKTLDPSNFLPPIVKKSDVALWEHALKDVLTAWMQDPGSPFQAVREEFGSPILNFKASSQGNETANQPTTNDDFTVKFEIQRGSLRFVALPLATDLHDKMALPAILFNYDREYCERTLATMLKQLEKSEEVWKTSSLEWSKRLKEYGKWKKTKLQTAKTKTGKTKAKKSQSQDDSEASKQDTIREEANQEASPWESFDPDGPVDLFSFADRTKLSDSELKTLIDSLENANLSDEIVNALRRGIAVHHAGMNRGYRQVVEMLFRKGFLRVVIATGTLALGINMPCKTVVFFGDSVFLTTLNYLQGAGRAGRRGFDVLGNVVFAGIAPDRVFEIMSSRLPDLHGHFPLSTTLVLRLLGLLHHTSNSDFTVRVTRSLLSQTRLYLGGPSNQLAIKHHLRFSIEYLRRQCLLSREGAPLNFSGLVGHLYFTENAVFAFHTLLKDGYFHQVCADIHRRPKDVRLELMLILSHLFCRVPIRNNSEEWIANIVRKSPSVILLPRLPGQAEEVLLRHNQETLSIFRTYVSSYVRQHLSDTPDTKLPFTGHDVQPRPGMQDCLFPINHLTPTKLRSPFAALSGFTDDFASIHELCTTVRSEVFLDEFAVPYIPIYPQDVARPWNAYIYDFFKHGDLTALVRDNRIKRGDVWFHLKDFSLILATIVTSLTNFLKPESPVDMTDVQDVGDVIQDGLEESQEDEPDLEAAVEVVVAQAAPPAASKKASKDPILESWDDELSDEESSPTTGMKTLNLDSPTAETPSGRDAVPVPAWQTNPGWSLMNVLIAFQNLQAGFDGRFRKVWA